MRNSIRSFIKAELSKLALGLLMTCGMLLALSLLRYFSTGTFLFIQIILVSTLMLAGMYLLSFVNFGDKWIRGSEIYLTIFAFTVSSFLLLNIDRSRSVYLLKWVDTNRHYGITTDKLELIGATRDLGGEALRQRIEEQIQSGNLYGDSEGLLRSTGRGHVLNSLFEIVARVENLDGYLDS